MLALLSWMLLLGNVHKRICGDSEVYSGFHTGDVEDVIPDLLLVVCYDYVSIIVFSKCLAPETSEVPDSRRHHGYQGLLLCLCFSSVPLLREA